MKSTLGDEATMLIEAVLAELSEIENGTETTIAEALWSLGYNVQEIDFCDTFELCYEVRKKAKKAHITLAEPYSEPRIIGLPYHYPFIVNHRKTQIKCPKCGSTNTARILYGNLAISENLQKKVDAKKIMLGGSSETGMDPTRHCNACHKKFGSPAVLSTGESYVDAITSIEFEDGGFFGGFTSISIEKDDKGATVNVTQSLSSEKIKKHITKRRWGNLINCLYDDCYLHEWKHHYNDPYILDGEQWSISIMLTGNRKREYYGSNAFPVYWKEVKKKFSNITR